MPIRASSFFAMVFLATALSGCAGNGINDLDNPFLGDWVGTYAASALGTSGQIDVDISKDGTLIGGTVEDGTGKTAQISGSVSEAGNVNATIDYTDGDPTALKGTVSLNDGHLTGNLTQGSGGSTVEISLDLLIRE